MNRLSWLLADGASGQKLCLGDGATSLERKREKIGKRTRQYRKAGKSTVAVLVLSTYLTYRMKTAATGYDLEITAADSTALAAAAILPDGGLTADRRVPGGLCLLRKAIGRRHGASFSLPNSSSV
jgi:hypothetical protein